MTDTPNPNPNPLHPVHPVRLIREVLAATLPRDSEGKLIDMSWSYIAARQDIERYVLGQYLPKKKAPSLVDYVGRHVYFRMSTAAYRSSLIFDVRPHINYEILSYKHRPEQNTLVATITNDLGAPITISLNAGTCAYLEHNTSWHVRHPNAGEPTNG